MKVLNKDKKYATITIAETSSGLKSFKATKNERGILFSSATRKSLKGEKGMKKLWQMLLVFAMAVSCVCAVACSNNENKTCKHDYEETVVAATCTTGGYTEHKCSKCGDTYKDNEVAALNHDMTDWAEKTPATCTAAQVLEKHCKRTGCDYEETKDGDAALNHDMEWTITLNPTCTEDGKKDGACKRTGCTYTETDVKIDKLGHHYVESKTDPKAKAATCTEDGLKVEICDNPGCDYDETRKESVIPALGHTDDGTKAVVTDPTCTEQGYTTYHCETCDQDYRDDYVNELGHEMALEQTVKVSCLTDGYELWICQRDNCEYSEKREINDKLDHVFDTDGNCKSGCGKTINDKLTWINTKYDVTYNESADRLTLIGGDPGKGQIQQFVTIPAFLFKTMKEAGKTQFAVNLYKWSETTPIFGLNLTEESADWKYTNNVDTSSDVMTITDEMVEKGFKFILLYADLTQRDPAWKAKVKTTGLDFDIEFIKPFDINDKSTWLSSAINGGYNAEKGRWVYVGGDNGKSTFEGVITVRAELLKAMKEANYASFTVSMIMSKDGQRPQFGLWDDSKGNYTWNHAHTGPSKNTITITDEMVANGKDIKVAYLDNNQQNPAWGATDITDGFDFDIEFIKAFDINDKTTWFTSDFDACTITDAGVFNFTGAGSAIKLSLKKEVIAAMVADNKTSIKFTFSRLNENEDTAYIISGYDELPGRQNGAWEHTFTFNDDMKANGINLTLNIFSCGWGGTWVAPTGVALTLAFA